MCPICWSVMILEGLAWLAGSIGALRLYKWIKEKNGFCKHNQCKCKNK